MGGTRNKSYVLGTRLYPRTNDSDLFLTSLTAVGEIHRTGQVSIYIHPFLYFEQCYSRIYGACLSGVLHGIDVKSKHFYIMTPKDSEALTRVNVLVLDQADDISRKVCQAT